MTTRIYTHVCTFMQENAPVGYLFRFEMNLYFFTHQQQFVLYNEHKKRWEGHIVNGAKGNRFEELDSLRGLASIFVFLSHVVQLSIISTLLLSTVNNSVLHIFWDGSASVDLFFVLSGFVLALPYIDPSRRIEFFPFWIRRALRIYPAYFAALLISLVLRMFVFHPTGMHGHGLGSWGLLMWPNTTPSLSVKDITEYILLILSMKDTSLDPVTWSLVVEMRESILFPLILIVIRYTRKTWHFIAVIAFSLAIMLLNHGEDTSSFLLLFIMGAYVAKYRVQIVERLVLSTSLTRAILWVLALGLYESRYGILHLLSGELFSNYVAGLGASLIIACTLSSRAVARVLTMRPLLFTGRISYSFYLLHLPILLTCVSILYPFIHSMFITAVSSLSITIVMSVLTYKFVEIPFQRIGKSLSRLVSSQSRTPTASFIPNATSEP